MSTLSKTSISAEEAKNIRQDRMRYSNNKISSTLALIAIVFDVIYFISIYRSDVGNYYYDWIIGLSVLTNLVFMLVTFLCEEGVKKYNLTYSYIMIALCVVQIVRIFILPLDAHNSVTTTEVQVMGDIQFWHLVAYLCCSAVCLLIGGIVGIIKHYQLKNYTASLS